MNCRWVFNRNKKKLSLLVLPICDSFVQVCNGNSVIFKPLLGLCLRKGLDVLLGVGRLAAAVYIKEIETLFGLIKTFLKAGCIAELAFNILLNKS